MKNIIKNKSKSAITIDYMHNSSEDRKASGSDDLHAEYFMLGKRLT